MKYILGRGKDQTKNAKQITEIVQSEHIWNFFVRSKLFRHAAPNEAVLNEACNILENRLSHYSEGHPERERKEKAVERLKDAIKNNRRKLAETISEGPYSE